MKYRMDFVTNSSSSSFVIARDEELTDKQKEIIIEYFKDNFLGKPLLTPDMSEEDIEKILEDRWCSDEEKEKLKEPLKRGKTVYEGRVFFDTGDEIGDLYEKAFDKLDGVDGIEIVDGDLSY